MYFSIGHVDVIELVDQVTEMTYLLQHQ